MLELVEKFETDSLEGEREPFHLNVQIETLNKEISILKEQLEKSRKDYEDILAKLFSRRYAYSKFLLFFKRIIEDA